MQMWAVQSGTEAARHRLVSARAVGRRRNERIRFRDWRQVYIVHGSLSLSRGGLHWLILGALELVISVVRLVRFGAH